MDSKEKESGEKKFGMGGFGFRSFEEMAEMMKSCCAGQGGMMDCCSMMRKMMKGEIRGKRQGNSENTGKTE